MRFPSIIAWFLTLGLALTSSASPGVSASAGLLRLGVTTHFQQRWPLIGYDRLASLPNAPAREAVSWAAIETVPGQYRFTAANSGFVDRLCRIPAPVLLVLLPRNTLYDSGNTVTSKAGRNAFAAFAAALVARYPGCVIALEIGNEINGPNGLTGIPPPLRARVYTDLLATLYPVVKRSQPGVLILGGSTNLIATGFLNKLFDAGALPFMDAVVVHPYRDQPENVDWELARLKDAMRRRGFSKPIWATEFGFAGPDARAAAGYLVKMAPLLNAAGVEEAQWYALMDDKWFPNLGLFSASGSEKPGAAAFRYFTRVVAGGGHAVRIRPEDTDVFHFAFGPDRQVLWGLGRAILVSGNAVFRNASGVAIARPQALTEEPVIVEGKADITLGVRIVLADSLYDFAHAPWSYSAIGPLGAVALVPVDGNWTTALGSPGREVAVNQRTVRPIGVGAAATRIAVDYKAVAAGQIHAIGCFRTLPGNTATYQVLENEAVKAQGNIAPSVFFDVPVKLTAGGRVRFLVASGGGASPPIFYRLRVARSAMKPPAC